MGNIQVIYGIVMALAMVSCKNPNSDSQLKWGMKSDLHLGTLFDIEPNNAIYVCDKNQSNNQLALDHVVTAVQQWAKTINRDRGLKIQKGCPPSGPNDALVLVLFTKKSKCGVNLGGCTSVDTKNTYDFLTVQILELNLDFADKIDLALHEVGHAWGNCDRYAADFDPSQHVPSAARGANCTGKNNGDFSKPSAMQVGGYMHPQKVTEDDALGMQEMAKDPKFASNAAWHQFFATGGQVATTPATPKTPQGTGQKIANGAQPSSNNPPLCGPQAIDPDQDGWGWENNATCKMQK